MAFVDSSTSQQEESYSNPIWVVSEVKIADFTNHLGLLYLTLKIFKSTFLLLAGGVLVKSRLYIDRTNLKIVSMNVSTQRKDESLSSLSTQHF